VSQRLSTSSVAPHDRLAYWVDAVCSTYVQLDCETPFGAPSIEGEICVNRLATLELTRVTASAQRVRRTPARIAAATEDRFLVSVQTQGVGAVVQDGRRAVLHQGDFALYDTTRPYDLIFEKPFQQYVLVLPGAALRSQLRDAQTLTARRVSGARGAGQIMISMIRTLGAEIDTLEPASASAVADGVNHILLAGLSTLGCATPQPEARLMALHREQIKQYVRERLRDPLLSVARMAADLRLSASTLHRVFADEPCSLSNWIWGQRLDAIQRELCDPRASARSVSEIAFAWGFNDAAHFSRAFKKRFACSPRDVRAGALPLNPGG